jgi:hypothetical protein
LKNGVTWHNWFCFIKRKDLQIERIKNKKWGQKTEKIKMADFYVCGKIRMKEN